VAYNRGNIKTGFPSSLIDEVAKLSKKPDNIELKNFWERFNNFKEPDKVPLQVWMNDNGWARYLNQDLIKIFKDPEEFLIFNLNNILYQKRLFADDTPVAAVVNVGFGPTIEPSLFGVKPIFRSDSTPWPGDNTQIIASEGDLDKLEYPDFYKSGLMPEVHYFYKELKKLAGKDLEINFPSFSGAHPFMIAEKLRGMENLFMDMHLNPGFVHKLMNYIVESIEHMEKERENFLGVERPGSIGIGADAVDCNLISPKSYLEFIHPYELKIAKYFKNGISYYHSCGNLTPILGHISNIPGMKILHCSPWTDFEKAVDICKLKGFILEKRMHSVNEIMIPNQEEMENTLKWYLDNSAGAIMYWAASLDGDNAADKLKMWLKAARKVLGNKSVKIDAV